MRKYKYIVFMVSSDDTQLESILNRFSDDGWKLHTLIPVGIYIRIVFEKYE